MGTGNLVRNHAFSRVGYYSVLAMTANACGLEPGAGAEVLDAYHKAVNHRSIITKSRTGWELDGTILKRSHRSMVARFLGLAEADLMGEMGDRWNKNHGKLTVRKP